MKKLIKVLLIWFLLGTFYYALEGFWRIPKGGYANISMLFVGGFAALCVGSINQIPRFYNMRIILQSIIGAGVVTLVEFLSGLVLNVWLGLHIWDYSNLPLNVMGQVCLLFSFFWFLLMPLCIWLEDAIRYLIWREGSYYSLSQIYKEFISFQ